MPFAAGLGVLLDPLRRKSSGGFIRVAPLTAIPDDGVPRMFSIVTDQVDAWNTTPNQPVGVVFLLRNPGDSTPIAYTATCPHAGCYIGYVAGEKIFRCPCHTSSFELNGSRIGGDSSVAPRGMDTLEVQLEPTETSDGAAGAEMVLVDYKRFQTGRHEKIATA
jgi:menaquinol-cytochrome c reductase iron-sulfur subunit